MARTTGGDVILDLMTTVAELKESARQQGEQMTTMATLMSMLATSREADVEQYGRLTTLLSALAEVVDRRFDEVDARLDRLEGASGK